MATVIQTSEDRFIAGDPPEQLPLGYHWCDWCRGDGLEYDWNDELTICGGCSGSCVVACEDTACGMHSSLHPC